MTDHLCDSSPTIQAIKEAQVEQGKSIAVIEAAARETRDATKELAGEMKQFMGRFGEQSVRHDEKIVRHGEDIDRLFQKTRRLEEDVVPALSEEIATARNAAETRAHDIEDTRIKPLEEDQAKREGWRGAARDIRVWLLAIISIVLGLQSLGVFK